MMTHRFKSCLSSRFQSSARVLVGVVLLLAAPRAPAASVDPTNRPTPQILTPTPPGEPRINGARVFGARPGHPFEFTIPTTGEEPITYSVIGLPAGLALDSKLGRITGTTPGGRGEYNVTITAINRLGRDSKRLTIKIGDQICLTPPMGWNSWNCFAAAVDESKVRAAAHAMVDSGLIEHGWTYINIDDTWQGNRGGSFTAIQGNKKFPDMAGLCDEIHGLGLKAGIYSTPWRISYAGYTGGSANNPDGTGTEPTTPANGIFYYKTHKQWSFGKYSFAANDARQWSAWGFDYLKYDWHPIQMPQVQEVHDALEACGRDIVLSLSNRAPIEQGDDWARLANCWRTTGDIVDTWKSMTSNGFSQDPWSRFAGPGHWNDPDMLVLGKVGWGPKLHATRLTPDEQYTHMTLWCLLSAPLLIGCDMTQLDEFTLNLLTNDEVLAVDQDPLGVQATRVSQRDGLEVWTKPLVDGTWAVGLFNRSGKSAEIPANFADLKLTGSQNVRDLWRQADLGSFEGRFSSSVASHGAILLRIGTPRPSQ